MMRFSLFFSVLERSTNATLDPILRGAQGEISHQANQKMNSRQLASNVSIVTHGKPVVQHQVAQRVAIQYLDSQLFLSNSQEVAMLSNLRYFHSFIAHPPFLWREA